MPTVLIARAPHQAEPLQLQLQALGFQVLLQPAIEFFPPESWDEADAALWQLLPSEVTQEMPNFDWLVFSSANGVQYFFDRYRYLAGNNEAAPPVKIAVAGTGTNEALLRYTGRQADVIPKVFCAEGMVEQLADEARLGKRFLLCRASRGRDVLRRKLQELGGVVTEIAFYRSVDVKVAEPEIVLAMQRGQIDYAVVTSSAVAGSLVKLFGNDLRRVSLVSISPLTSVTLTDLGFPSQYEASEASVDGIVQIFKSLASGHSFPVQ